MSVGCGLGDLLGLVGFDVGRGLGLRDGGAVLVGLADVTRGCGAIVDGFGVGDRLPCGFCSVR